MRPRPFRFGLQVVSSDARSWTDQARRAEAVGFDVVTVADHAVDGLASPMVAIAAIAEATTRLRVGTLVLNNDFRHPALLAREAVTVDLLSDGRLELGLGAGHAEPEYQALGLRFDPPAVRVERLAEAVEILDRLFAGETVSVAGRHYQLHEHRLVPVRRPTLLIGGNGNRVLELAARHADIVGFTGLGRTLADGQRHEAQWREEQIDAKVARVRAAAGRRVDTLEFNALVQHIQITTDRRRAVEPIARFTDADPDLLLAAPFLLIGTVPEIVEQLHHARDRWGFTYFVTRDADATAPVIDALRAEP